MVFIPLISPIASAILGLTYAYNKSRYCVVLHSFVRTFNTSASRQRNAQNKNVVMNACKPSAAVVSCNSSCRVLWRWATAAACKVHLVLHRLLLLPRICSGMKAWSLYHAYSIYISTAGLPHHHHCSTSVAKLDHPCQRQQHLLQGGRLCQHTQSSSSPQSKMDRHAF